MHAPIVSAVGARPRHPPPSAIHLLQLTLNRSGVLPNSFLGGDVGPEALRANLQVPKTQFSGADATLLNTVMEVALPGFLLIDYNDDLRADARLTAGGAGTIFRGSLLQPEAIKRNGVEVVAIKEVADWPSLSEEDNEDRFHQEVSIMWSLSFHPNVIKLVGYCENPRCIVTKLYPTDMFRYLHTQEDKSPLESHLLLHLCSGTVAALAAAHSMGIAHRDIKSPNYLMQEPRPGTPFPDPILSDFAHARVEYAPWWWWWWSGRWQSGCDRGIDMDAGGPAGLVPVGRGVGAYESVRDEDGGPVEYTDFSPRYAAPEVFARRNAHTTALNVDDDQKGDVYAFAVLIWEALTRQVRAGPLASRAEHRRGNER